MTEAARDRWFVYVARCADGSLYTGIARDVAARLRAHDEGKGARYTRGRGPLTLCAVRRCSSKGDALRLELAIKRLARLDKERMMQDVRVFRAFARGVVARGLRASKPASAPRRPRGAVRSAR